MKDIMQKKSFLKLAIRKKKRKFLDFCNCIIIKYFNRYLHKTHKIIEQIEQC